MVQFMNVEWMDEKDQADKHTLFCIKRDSAYKLKLYKKKKEREKVG